MSGRHLRLGVFGANKAGGNTMTLVPERNSLDWERHLDTMTRADRAGFEALIPVAGWTGDATSAGYETFTWAAAVAQATRSAQVFATAHVTMFEPVVAAKMGATIDQISGGRFGLNLVCGWRDSDARMIGRDMLAHDDRYAYAAEWLGIVQRLWRGGDAFDHHGRFFDVEGMELAPGPVREGGPRVINAGSSPVGRAFAARHADAVFTNLGDRSPGAVERAIRSAKTQARDEFARAVEVWAACYVVCRPTQREAEEYLRHYAEENADHAALDAMMGAAENPVLANASPEVRGQMRRHFAAGFGGYPLVGTPDRICDELERLADADLDGCALSWVDFGGELDSWVEHVLPRMEARGLRTARPTGAASVR